MVTQYTHVRKEDYNQEKMDRELIKNLQRMSHEERIKKEKERRDEESAHLANRALLLLSFKDTTTQNLRYVLKVLGIRTLEDKEEVLQEIYRLIREGIVYISKGFPQFIDQGSSLDADNLDAGNIDLCLLRPYDQIIKEIQSDIAEMKKKEKRRQELLL